MGSDQTLHGLVLAPYGRDAQLLGEALAEISGSPVFCNDLADLLTRMQSGPADLLVISDDALVSHGDDRVLAALRARAEGRDDILPLVLLTGKADLVHPINRFPGVVVLAKPTRRRILDSVLRGALDTRRRVLEIQTQRQQLQERNRTLLSMTRTLEAHNIGLREAVESKDRFVATMSHELRTPLNSILLYADLLDLETQGPLNIDQRRYVSRIMLSARHLVELIGGVLDLAKLNANQLIVECSPMDLPAEVQHASALVAPVAEEKGLRLTLEPPAEILPPVLGDHLRVRQVVLNLLSNAVKFTERGGVTIQFRRDGDDSVSVLIKDSGVGIDSEELANLFTDFYQADNDLTRRHEGTGLGLAISKRLTHLMGGTLSAESRPRKGSVFTFTLPTAVAAQREATDS